MAFEDRATYIADNPDNPDSGRGEVWRYLCISFVKVD